MSLAFSVMRTLRVKGSCRQGWLFSVVWACDCEALVRGKDPFCPLAPEVRVSPLPSPSGPRPRQRKMHLYVWLLAPPSLLSSMHHKAWCVAAMYAQDHTGGGGNSALESSQEALIFWTDNFLLNSLWLSVHPSLENTAECYSSVL